ncbi:F5/8 type C domain-containing protein [Fulvimarina manganoxydans]|uniref:F5/8 type C domain-containing protein n=2 Tax=Fulvimarina manganoxydans TaxID=937218 RepID=A0A1W2EL16_9HYPH|nr:F5/8 type C domain-containing protein [Fulvimarina manganoxydans]
MSSPLPTSSDGYAVTVSFTISPEVWNAVIPLFHDRLVAIEDFISAGYTAAQQAGTAMAQAIIQQSVTPQIAQINATISGFEDQLALAEDRLAALNNGGVVAANVTIMPVEGLDATNAQDAIAALAGFKAKFPAFAEANGEKFVRFSLDGSGFESAFVSFDPVYDAIGGLSDQIDGMAAEVDSAASSARLNALYIAELRGDRLNMVDGIVDPYTDTSDVSGASSNHLHNAQKKQFEYVNVNLSTLGLPISGGDKGASTAKGKAFDGDAATYWASSQSGSPVNGNAYIGRDFGAATVVKKIIIKNASATNNAVYSAAAQYSDDGANWVSYSNQGFSQTGGNTQVFDVSAAGAHRYWRVLATSTSANGSEWWVAEMTFEGAPAPMTLISSVFSSVTQSPSVARVAVQLAPPLSSSPVVPNVDLISSVSRDGGVTFSVAALEQIAVLTDGTKIYEGFADLTGQPAGASMVYKHVTANAKDAPISGTIMQWRG